MKKILKTRKAIQGLAMALALATTISGCSFNRTADDLTPESSTVYESVEESHDHTHDFVEEDHTHETQETEVETDKTKDDSIREENDRKNGKEETTEDKKTTESKEEEMVLDLTQESFTVMFEGQELVIPNLYNQYNSGAYTKFSINYAMKKAGFDNSYAYRATLARFFGIKNYRGTSSQNILLLTYLRNPQVYLDMSQVISSTDNKTNTDINQGNGQATNTENTNGNGNGNNGGGNGNGGGSGNHGGEEDKKHEHKLGNVIIEYTNITETQHTVVKYRLCSDCQQRVGLTTTTVNHAYGEWTLNQAGDKETAKCACGHTTERKVEHQHGDWKTVDYKYVALDDGQHRVDEIQQCQRSIDGKICTETRIVEGKTETCKYGDDDVCRCGNIKGHEHGDWVEVRTELVPLENGQHRVDSVQQCKVLIAGKECTFTRTVPGEKVDCNWTLNDQTQCQCGNKHTHKYDYEYLSETQEQGTCPTCGKTTTRSHTGVKETETTTVVYNGYDGHRFKVTVHCSGCDHDLADQQTELRAHNEVSTGKSDIQSNGAEHWYNESFECKDCHYNLGTREVDKAAHTNETTYSAWQGFKDAISNIFRHSRNKTVTCTVCGKTNTTTETNDCSPLGTECSDCHQSTYVHQCEEYQGTVEKNVKQDGVCMRIPVYECGDANCPDHKNDVLVRYINTDHTPQSYNIDNPYLGSDGNFYVGIICGTCGYQISAEIYDPNKDYTQSADAASASETGGTPRNDDEHGITFDIDTYASEYEAGNEEPYENGEEYEQDEFDIEDVQGEFDVEDVEGEFDIDEVEEVAEVTEATEEKGKTLSLQQ